MISYKLIFKNTYDIDWDYVESLDEFKALKKAQQNPKWHSEGNAFIHTKNVVDSMKKLIESNVLNEFTFKGLVNKKPSIEGYDTMDVIFVNNPSDDDNGKIFALYEDWVEIGCDENVQSYNIKINSTNDHKRMLMAAALFHDIGKGECTFFQNGNWHSYNHENIGANMLSDILTDIDDETKNKIISLVRNHMKPLQIIGTKNFHKKMKEMAHDVNLYDLYYLKLSDINGSEQLNGGTKEEDLGKMRIFMSEIPNTYEDILNEDNSLIQDMHSEINRISSEKKNIEIAINVLSKYGYYNTVRELSLKKELMVKKLFELKNKVDNFKVICNHSFEDCGPDNRLFGIYNVRRCKKCGYKIVDKQ